MKNLRYPRIIHMNMESFSEMIEHQTLATAGQLVDDDGSVLLTEHHTTTAVGGGLNDDEDDDEDDDGNGVDAAAGLLLQQRSTTATTTSTLATTTNTSNAITVGDEHIGVAHTLVTTSDEINNASDGISGDSVLMVRTIIDGLNHSPEQTTYQALRGQQTHLPLQQQQQTRHIIANGLLHRQRQQQQHEQYQQQTRLSASSPVDFVGSDVTLDALSVGSSSNSAHTHTHIIAVKQEHNNVVIINSNNNNANNNNNSSNNNNMSRNNASMLCLDNQQQHDNIVGVAGVMDELSSDAVVEVTLNEHHHQHIQQQQQQQQLLQQQQQHRQYQSQHIHHTQQQHNHHHHTQSVQTRHHNQQHQQQQHALASSHQQHNSHHHHHQQRQHVAHHEALSVIVQPHDDSCDSSSTTQMLSPELVGVVDGSLAASTYQTLTSVNERMSPPAGFSPTSSSYATLTPLQPLPPISTMSDKFAYGGHISGVGVSGGGNSNSNSSSNGVGGPFPVMPHQNSLVGGLSLSGLSGVQSPYSSYDKLTSMGMSMSPPAHNYASSPSHALSGMVVACDLHAASPSPCGGALSPQSVYSHTTELHSPPGLAACKTDGGNSNHHHSCGAGTIEVHRTSTKQLVCLSPITICNGGSVVVGDNVVSDYESPYGVHQRDLMVIARPSSSASITAGCKSRLQLQHSPTLSPHSMSVGSVTLHSPGASSMANQSLASLPLVSGGMATLSSAASLSSVSSNALVELTALQRDGVVMALTPTPPPSATTTTLLAIQQTDQQHQQQQATTSGNIIEITRNVQQQQHEHEQQLLQQHSKTMLHPVTSDCNLNGNLNGNGLRLTSRVVNNISNNNSDIICNIEQQQQQQQQQQEHIEQLDIARQPVRNTSSTPITHNNNNNNGHHHKNNNNPNITNASGSGSSSTDMEEINTKELAQRISAELKRYSIPQAIFAQRVLCRSQGTLSDLLRNPKPWSKLKSGRETFRRMFKWLQEPEFQRMSALRMAAAQIPQRGGGGGGGVGSGNVCINSAASVVIPSTAGMANVNNNNNNESVALAGSNISSSCGGGGGSSGNNGLNVNAGVLSSSGNSGAGSGSSGVVIPVNICRRKDEPHIEHMPQPKKPRLVFTDLQRRTLQAIFKETKRPSKEMQVTIARQLGLEPTTVGNFFMNARRRSMDKWRDDDSIKSLNNHAGSNNQHLSNNNNNNNNNLNNHHQQQQHHMSLSAVNVGNIVLHNDNNHNSLDLDDENDMDLDLGHDDFDLDATSDGDMGDVDMEHVGNDMIDDDNDAML